jgi:hypothetical protein
MNKNPCKGKAFEKYVKGFVPKTPEIVDKLKDLLTSALLKRFSTKGSMGYSWRVFPEIQAIPDFSSGNRNH